jgi:hypothetical protein
MLIGPMLAGDNPEKVMVEPPGIAPGSNPLIARAFISIVRPKPDLGNIGAKGYRFQKRLEKKSRAVEDPDCGSRAVWLARLR